MKRLEGLPINDDQLRDEYTALATLRDSLTQSSEDVFSLIAAYFKIREPLFLALYREWLSLVEETYRSLSALDAYMTFIDELINDIEDEVPELSSSKELMDACVSSIYTEFENFQDLIV